MGVLDASKQPRVGLVVNPHAGRDIRRLVAHASSLTNHERVAVVRRLLVGLHAAGVTRVLAMPDRHGIVERAAIDVPGIEAIPVDVEPMDTPEATRQATRLMVEAGVRVLVTHGGDGTNRLVALEAGEVPMLPIAAGTNNVFPTLVEATSAGFAAGWLSGQAREEAVRRGAMARHKRVLACVGARTEMAVVDAALTEDSSIGARAVWDPARIRAFMVTRAQAGSVGLASLVGCLATISEREPRGAFAELGPGTRVAAFIAPGLVAETNVARLEIVGIGESVEVGPCDGTLTLDGERSVHVRGARVRFTLDADGPWVVDAPATLRWAQEAGGFVLGDGGQGQGLGVRGSVTPNEREESLGERLGRESIR